MVRREDILQALEKRELQVSGESLERLSLYSEKLLAANREFNLLARGQEKVFLERHLVDSLVALPLLSPWPGPWVDLGTGGGLPGLPLAICSMSRPVFLVESKEKKARFLEKIVSLMGLERVLVLNTRAEELARNPEYREQANVVMARGLAPLPSLLELALPLIRVGGILLAWKGPALDEELEKSQQALEILGGKAGERYYQGIPGQGHFLQVIKKVESTPERFPRRPAAIKKRPLGGKEKNQ